MEHLAFVPTGNSDIVITRTVGAVTEIIAELDRIEELVVNTVTTPVGGGAAGADNVVVVGNFGPTNLALNTITINGSEGDDVVDISQLDSAHRIVFRSNGGDDMVVGTLRPQDVVDLAPGLTAADYGDPQHDGNGMWTITQNGGGHSVSYAGDANMVPPVFAASTAIGDAGQNGDQTDGGQVGSQTDTSTDTGQNNDTSGNGGTGDTIPYVAAMSLTGDAGSNTLVGNTNGDILAGLEGNDALLAGEGDNVVYAGEGNDEVITGSGNDIVLGGDGNDMIITGDGNDIIDGGLGRDLVQAGDGDDLVLARFDDGNDVYNGGLGNDTIDLSAITADATIDLGIGRVSSDQTGSDMVSGFENAVGGQGNDLIIANGEVNVLTGGHGEDTFEFRSAAGANNDSITDFEQGDSINLSGVFGGQDVTFMEGTTFAPGGQVIVYASGDDAIIEGDANNDGNADFAITLVGRADLGDFTY
ncbi:MAG: Ca2+-binding RTX toxin-like protein [Alphaproteobacteria bacterium]|jgi:Ca2+-binding RTX toxin-like protein